MSLNKQKVQLPQGFNCGTCATFHKYDAYVLAHASDVLVHTCDKCGAKHEIFEFVAEQIEEGRKL